MKYKNYERKVINFNKINVKKKHSCIIIVFLFIFKHIIKKLYLNEGLRL